MVQGSSLGPLDLVVVVAALPAHVTGPLACCEPGLLHTGWPVEP